MESWFLSPKKTLREYFWPDVICFNACFWGLISNCGIGASTCPYPCIPLSFIYPCLLHLFQYCPHLYRKSSLHTDGLHFTLVNLLNSPLSFSSSDETTSGCFIHSSLSAITCPASIIPYPHTVTSWLILFLFPLFTLGVGASLDFSLAMAGLTWLC